MKSVSSSLFLIIIFCVSCKKNDSSILPDATDSLKIGLIAHYPFNGNEKDESGNNYNLQNDGALLSEDRLGNANSAYSFNGINAKMIIPEMAKAGSLRNFTLSFWAKMDSLHYIISFLSNPKYRCAYSSYIAVQKDLFGNYISENDFLDSDTANFCERSQYPFIAENPENKWVHFVLVQHYEASGPHQPFYLYHNYINGVSINSFYGSAASHSFPNPVSLEYGGCIGCYTFNEFDGIIQYSNFYKGLIDDVRLYDRALSESDIEKLYALDK